MDLFCEEYIALVQAYNKLSEQEIKEDTKEQIPENRLVILDTLSALPRKKNRVFSANNFDIALAEYIHKGYNPNYGICYQFRNFYYFEESENE